MPIQVAVRLRGHSQAMGHWIVLPSDRKHTRRRINELRNGIGSAKRQADRFVGQLHADMFYSCSGLPLDYCHVSSP